MCELENVAFEISWGEKSHELSEEKQTKLKLKSTRETLLLHPKAGVASEIIFLYKHFSKYSGLARVLRFR